MSGPRAAASPTRSSRAGAADDASSACGSVSKPITAAAVARLNQEGRLDVDADVRDYVPAFRQPVTLRQLGGHLGGIRHYEGAEAVNTTHYRSLSESLRVFIDDPLVAEPGDRFSYSSYGFNLLGAAVEAATNAPFGRPSKTSCCVRCT